MADSNHWTDASTRSLSVRVPADIQCDQAFKNYTSTAALIWPRRPIKRANRPGGSSFDGS